MGTPGQMDQGSWHCTLMSVPGLTTLASSHHFLTLVATTALCKHNILCAQNPAPVPVQVALFGWAKSYQGYELDLYQICIPLSELLWNMTVSALIVH